MGRTSPVVGITATRGKQVDRYEEAIRHFGAEPLKIDRDVGAIKQVDALILSGGPDVDPVRFGETIPSGLEGKVKVNAERDAVEWQLLDSALSRGIPILAICRGVQLVNVYHGGDLYQDLSWAGLTEIDHDPKGPRDSLGHSVEIVAGRLRELAGCSELQVNSIHHQGIRKPSPRLMVTAISKDGVIEGLESRDGKIIGVQWHPEELFRSQHLARMLFEDLMARAGYKAQTSSTRNLPPI
jgi:putative glutamine amidotransferase